MQNFKNLLFSLATLILFLAYTYYSFTTAPGQASYGLILPSLFWFVIVVYTFVSKKDDKFDDEYVPISMYEKLEDRYESEIESNDFLNNCSIAFTTYVLQKLPIKSFYNIFPKEQSEYALQIFSNNFYFIRCLMIIKRHKHGNSFFELLNLEYHSNLINDAQYVFNASNHFLRLFAVHSHSLNAPYDVYPAILPMYEDLVLESSNKETIAVLQNQAIRTFFDAYVELLSQEEQETYVSFEKFSETYSLYYQNCFPSDTEVN